MPRNRPSITVISDRINADIERHTDGNPHLRGAIEHGVAKAMTGMSHVLHGNDEFLAKQLFDDTAEDEYLLRRALPFGITQIAATESVGAITLAGNEAAIIDAGEELQAPDGQLYTTDAQATITGGTATIAITAADAGAEGNQDASTVLTFTTPPSGVDSEGTVDAPGLTGGADIESMDRVRERFAERKATPPRGGTTDDYIAWSKQAHVDVTRVWVFKHVDQANAQEYGSILIYFVTDDLASPIPTQAIRDAVYDYIHLPGVRPAGAKNVYVEILTAVPLDMTFASLTPNTATVQTAIEAETADMLKRESAPNGTLLLSHIREAISISTDEDDYDLTTPNADVTSNFGEIIVPGVVTWPGA